MTDLLTPVAVERELARLIAAAEQLAHDVATTAETAARAEHAYKAGHAKAYLRADGPVAEREAKALLAVDELHLDYKIGQARLLAAQEAGRACRSSLDALRSVNATVRRAAGLDF